VSIFTCSRLSQRCTLQRVITHKAEACPHCQQKGGDFCRGLVAHQEATEGSDALELQP